VAWRRVATAARAQRRGPIGSESGLVDLCTDCGQNQSLTISHRATGAEIRFVALRFLSGSPNVAELRWRARDLSTRETGASMHSSLHSANQNGAIRPTAPIGSSHSGGSMGHSVLPAAGRRALDYLLSWALRREFGEIRSGTARERRDSLGYRLWGGRAGWDYNFEGVYQLEISATPRSRLGTFGPFSVTRSAGVAEPRLGESGHPAKRAITAPGKSNVRYVQCAVSGGAYFGEKRTLRSRQSHRPSFLGSRSTSRRRSGSRST